MLFIREGILCQLWSKFAESSVRRPQSFRNISVDDLLDSANRHLAVGLLNIYHFQVQQSKRRGFFGSFPVFAMRYKKTGAFPMNHFQSYRFPLAVTEIFLFYNGDTFPVCPRCRITLEREYQSYCDRCGQRLDWRTYEQAHIVTTL